MQSNLQNMLSIIFNSHLSFGYATVKKLIWNFCSALTRFDLKRPTLKVNSDLLDLYDLLNERGYGSNWVRKEVLLSTIKLLFIYFLQSMLYAFINNVWSLYMLLIQSFCHWWRIYESHLLLINVPHRFLKTLF